MKKILHQFEEGLLALLLLFMVGTVFAEVVARKMGVGIHWAQEATLLANAWMVLLGMSYCVREKAHICVEVVTAKLPGKVAKIVLLLALAASLLYCALYLYGSFEYVAKMKQLPLLMQDLPLKRWIARLCLLIGFALLALRFIEAAYRVLIHNDLNVLHHVGEVDDSMALAEQLKTEQLKSE